MKRCPTCSRVYDDGSLRFCFDDGTELINKTSDDGPPATAVMPASAENAQSTIQAPPPNDGPATRMQPIPVARKRSALPWVLGAAALVLVLGVTVVAAILMLRPKHPLVMHLVLRLPSSTPNRDVAVNQSVEVIESRLNAYGVPTFQVIAGKAGSGQILVNLPALENPERVKQIVSAWGKLEFVHVLTPPNPQPVQTFATAQEALASAPNTADSSVQRRALPYVERLQPDADTQPKRWVVVEMPAIVDGSQLINARAVPAGYEPDAYTIQFSLSKAAAEKFGAWTGSHINEYLGIVLDDEVKSSPFIKSQISDQGEITGRFTKQSAEDLALVLNSGALPGRPELIEEKVDKQ
jgi:protein-export membrane protein SecD